ncbi:MAG: YihY/virulence factor BrkB family protein [Bacteroidetes bacterium]|nr:YihY/virulence factor BrkB family protein [Bacteroidota bacterium]
MKKTRGISLLKRALRLLEDFITLRWVRNIWMYLVRIAERMESNHIFLSAAGLSFNALLCFIPLLLLIFYALGLYLNSADAMSTVDTWIQKLELFPYQKDQLREMVMSLMQEFVSGSHLAGALGGVGLLWTSSALFAALRTALNRVFSIQDTKNIFVSKLKDFAMLSIVGIALMAVTVFLYGVSLIKEIGENIFGVQFQSWIFNDAVNLISPFVLSFVLFLLVFYLVPDRRLSGRLIITSSAIAAVLWGIAKFIFAYYLTNMWKFGTIYGPYAIIVATAIWVYYSSVTVLFAAEIAEMSSERKEMRDLFSTRSLTSVVRRSLNANVDFPRTPTLPSWRRRFRDKDAE